MRFKIDQNLPVELARILQQAGHDALTVLQQYLGGAPDPKIVAVCRQEHRVLITADLDLSDIREYPPEQNPGFIVLRLKEQTKPKQIALLQRTIPLLATNPVAGRLWIVEEGKVRIRGGPAT
jgi:predicted nuclease of predicted toxin-antitoxin system